MHLSSPLSLLLVKDIIYHNFVLVNHIFYSFCPLQAFFFML
nr:MAG TPA: hypothetical protein [Caudoviricetes sp.]